MQPNFEPKKVSGTILIRYLTPFLKIFRMKKIFTILIFVSLSFLMLSFVAQAALEYPLPGLQNKNDPTPCDYLRALYIWGLGIVGALAVTTIAIGGFLYMTGQVQKGKDYILSALLGLLLLLGSWLLLNTINPDLAKLKCDLPQQAATPPPATLPPGTPPPSGNCNNPQQLAQQNNVPYPAKNAPETDTLLNCVKAKLTGQNLGEISTFDKSHDICNYIRGKNTCGSCSHSPNSCHYGGSNGSTGSLAIDFGNEKIGDTIIQAVNQCGGAKSARCEDNRAITVACSSSGATHVHASLSSCSGN